MSVQTRILAVSALLAGAALSAPGTLAQGESASMIEEIVTVGTRRIDGRSATDSLVPVDVITGNDLMTQGSTDMDRLLANLVPSYNINQQPINDAATLVKPAQLRGLPPDATLVLVNGKRRHRAAVISFLGNGVVDGSQGPDISTIPAIALRKIEVLRDGAAAQYGSDAIAGVINFILKDDDQGGAVEARWGQFYEGDGDLVSLAANRGFPLGDDGFANFSFEYKQSDRTDRSQQRDDAIDHIATGSPAAQAIQDSANSSLFQPNVQVWGAPEFDYDYKAFGNFGKALSEGREAYGHINYAKRKVEGGFFYRNPHTRSGVFLGDPTASTDTSSSKPTVRVANLHVHNGATNNDGCPTIEITDDVADAAKIEEVRKDPNCESFITRFPGGFTPRFGAELEDFSVMFGVRGQVGDSEWHMDASGVYGRHEAAFFMRHTVNPQLLAKPGITAANIPTDYEPGAYTQTDYTFNLDLSRQIEVPTFAEPLNFALGFEHRQEQFEVHEGGENSWFQDLCAGMNDENTVTTRTCPDANRDASLTAQGFNTGSNGFTGFGPRLAGTWSRDSNAAYVDLEAQVTDPLSLGVAVRYEDHNDVGETTDFKLSGRIDISDTSAFRGAVSSGFRAPTPGQSNVFNVTTAISEAGKLEDEVTLPPTHPVAAQVGGKPLTPEESNNITVGAVFNWGIADFTLDFFRIKLKDRIARSSNFTLSQADTDALKEGGVADADSFSTVRFYTNDFDTTTHGVDLVVTWQADMFRGTTDFSLAANWTTTEVDKANPEFVNAKRVIQLEENLPRTRVTLSANHAQGDWNFLTRVRYYGGFTEFSTDGNLGTRLDADARTLVDLEVSYLVNDDFTVIFGGDNVFDTYPTTIQAMNGNVLGLKYAETSPYGFNGGYYYLRGLWDF